MMLKRVRHLWISLQAGERDERSFKGDASYKAANRFIGAACVCPMNARAGMRRSVETIATRAARWVRTGSRWMKSNHLLLVSCGDRSTIRLEVRRPRAARLDFIMISNTV